MSKSEIIDLIERKEQIEYQLLQMYEECFGCEDVNTKLKRQEWQVLYDLLVEIKLRDTEV